MPNRCIAKIWDQKFEINKHLLYKIWFPKVLFFIIFMKMTFPLAKKLFTQQLISKIFFCKKALLIIMLVEAPGIKKICLKSDFALKKLSDAKI